MLVFGRPVRAMMVAFRLAAESISDDAHTAAFAPFWRAAPKIVSYAGMPADERTSRAISGNLAGEVAALKARDGRDMLLTGGASLAEALAGLGLIDEYHIAVHPVVLGGGRRLFGGATERRHLRVVDSRTVDGQVVVTHYR
jgi:dihydrofolate reductase